VAYPPWRQIVRLAARSATRLLRVLRRARAKKQSCRVAEHLPIGRPGLLPLGFITGRRPAGGDLDCGRQRRRGKRSGQHGVGGVADTTSPEVTEVLSTRVGSIMTGKKQDSSDAGVPCEGFCKDARRTNHGAQTMVVSRLPHCDFLSAHFSAILGENDIIFRPR
jgi:hypothetical protein